MRKSFFIFYLLLFSIPSLLGQKSKFHNFALSLDKMNILYAGIPNPISIAVPDSLADRLTVRLAGNTSAKLEHRYRGSYLITPDYPTERMSNCVVELWDSLQNKRYAAYFLRVKKIPNPVVKLSNNKRDQVSSCREMRVQRGLMAILSNFDFDARCKVNSFSLTLAPQGRQPIKVRNQGARFEQAAFQLITHAYEGDTLFFEDIQMRCPGDPEDRQGEGFQILITCKEKPQDKAILSQSTVQKAKNLDALYRQSIGLDAEPSFPLIDDHYVRDFTMTYIPLKGDSIQLQNTGDTFEEEALDYIQKAVPGDEFIFTKIRTENIFEDSWFIKDFYLMVGD